MLSAFPLFDRLMVHTIFTRWRCSWGRGGSCSIEAKVEELTGLEVSRRRRAEHRVISIILKILYIPLPHTCSPPAPSSRPTASHSTELSSTSGRIAVTSLFRCQAFCSLAGYNDFLTLKFIRNPSLFNRFSAPSLYGTIDSLYSCPVPIPIPPTIPSSYLVPSAPSS
jgi:hypothetical protein